jgi:hypothetical protein
MVAPDRGRIPKPIFSFENAPQKDAVIDRQDAALLKPFELGRFA